MPDVKKLITGFLVLATATASSALILSNAGRFSSQNVVPSSALTDNTVPLANQNAFVATPADVAAIAAVDDPDVAAALNDPNNLTSNFTDAFLSGVSAANPDGLNTDTNGNAQINTPSEQSVAAAFLQNPAMKSVQIPNWDADVASVGVKVSNATNTDSYSNAINAAFSKDIIQSGAESVASEGATDPASLSTVAPAIQNTLSDAAQTPTPASLVGFQKSLVKMLVYQKNMLALAQAANTDPVKASVIYQAEELKYTVALQDFENEAQKASQKNLFSFNSFKMGSVSKPPSVFVALFNSVLGVQTAHAFLGVGDIDFDPAVFGQFILQLVNSTILQILKNTITAFLQQRVLKWIQGSGAPKFVQQWGSAMATAYTNKALASMSQVLAVSCPNIQTALKPMQANLQASAGVGGGAGGGAGGNSSAKALACPIPASSQGQLNNFYGSFNAAGVQGLSGGSWGLYAQVLNPSGGNYAGVLLGASGVVNSQGAAAQQAARNKDHSESGV